MNTNDFWCCGGNDETPKEHTMDCETRCQICAPKGIYECRCGLTPVVGMEVSYQIGSDRYPYTIVKVSASGKTFWAQEADAELTEGSRFGEQQTYSFKPNPNGKTVRAFFTTGAWFGKGGVGIFSLKGYSKYMDPSF